MPSPSSKSGNGPPAGIPPRVCSFFWTTGSCSRGFECSFKHERQPATTTSATEGEPDQEEENETTDFFSAEGLALNNGSVREERHNLTPSQAHNHIKPFLSDNFMFENASKIQGFVRILASVNDRNKAWAFLYMIVNGNVLLRIGDVIRFRPVSHMIGYNGGTLSFQKGYFPIFEYFASSLVLKTTLHKNINHLYTILENNYDSFSEVINSAVGGMIQQKSWKDPTPNLNQSLQSNLDGVVIFKTLATVLYQLFTRFKDAIRNHPDIAQLVDNLTTWFDIWVADVSAIPPRFQDNIVLSDPRVRQLTITQLREELSRLQSIVQRESNLTQGAKRGPIKQSISPAERQQALVSQLYQTYDPPGSLRRDGVRHDNDFDNIASIRIAPTQSELLSPVAPYLPVFLSDAPHHLPAGSMERHLDVQFRLLREELFATMRSSLAAIYGDLETMWQNSSRKRQQTKLEELLKSKGGAYRTSGFDSVFFQVYTGVEFSPVKAERRDLTVGLVVDTPNHRAARDSDAKKRYDYWDHSKRLQSGSLVALVLVSYQRISIFLGVITSFGKDIAESSKVNASQIQVRVSFFDAEVELMALRRERTTGDASTFTILIDDNVMFEAARPFLERLQTIEPTEIPFARYLAHNGALEGVQLRPPLYATAPGFKYKLECLEKPGHRGRIQSLNINLPGAADAARRQLLQSSTLDPSQVEAVVNTLTREVSLIQGPPGTGKSFTAKEILRVLFASGIKPIDHMLTSVLDAGITRKLVRLGSRSSDERISEYTLDKLEKIAGGSPLLDRPIKRQYAIMKKLEEEMSRVMELIQIPALSWDAVEQFLDIHFPDHVEGIRTPPFWITTLSERIWAEEAQNGEWKTAGKKKDVGDEEISRTFYGFWKTGQDIAFIDIAKTPASVKRKGKKKRQSQPAKLEVSEPEVLAFFESLGYGANIPSVPTTTRSLPELLEADSIWRMSIDERTRLAAEWEQRIRQMAYTSNLQHYEELRQQYKSACKEYSDIRDETRRRLMSQTDLIACTTTGAAKLITLLSTISPKVLMVEEAGQVLEAHILTSLVSSIHHLICIGDPQQLRPTLATFALSMDSERGRQLYKFDRSLMERLADNGLPMSQINMQRRMRPSISHFIRQILYPRLEDNEIVQTYPHVQGMQQDVFFFNHTHKENGSDDSVSKYNDFEVIIIRDLVLYLLRQGIYNEAGDIAVLCAYLGQLQKVRAALRDLKIAVAVDERDQEQLARQGMEEDTEFEEVLVAKHVRLGTVDIFQGQEAKIVIVSLVRNSGTFETGSASIGFLKSSNRINVALSRAKHGLYILGNAANLRRNETWSVILDDLEARDQIGLGLPIVCPRHPDEKHIVTKAGELPHIAPGGGCLLPCGYRLDCGHIVILHLTTIVPRNALCLATELPVPVDIPARSIASRIAESANSPCAKLRYPVGMSRIKCLVVGSETTCSMRAHRRYSMLARPIYLYLQGGLRGRSDVLLEIVQVALLTVPEGNTNLSSAMRSSQMSKALLRTLCSVYGTMHLGLCSSQLSSSLRIETAPMWSSMLIRYDRKSDIVDFIMQRRLDEIDPTSDDTSERLITLDCGHSFTVETLDGHCGMSDYYDIDPMGRFVAPKAPPINYQSPPTCPTCRGPITALRYGRVTKRATLDILEQNVAGSMSSSLQNVVPAIERISTNLQASLASAQAIASHVDVESEKVPVRDAVGRADEPLESGLFGVGAMHAIHGFSKNEATAWNNVVKDILATYRTIARIAKTRGAHIKAYEAALTTLYRLEMEQLTANATCASDTPEAAALDAVNAKIGQPPHKADTRYQIEAFLVSLELRFMLAQIAAGRIEGLSLTSGDEMVIHHRLLWTSFIDFVLESCVEDSRKALAIAHRSSASRQAARCVAYILRSEFERFRSEILEEWKQLRRLNQFATRKQELAEKVQAKRQDLRGQIEKAEGEYIRSRPSQTLQDLRDERRWYSNECRRKMEKWVEECNELEQSILKDKEYQPLTHQEREEIVKAFGFSHRGHFYNCENGHTFVITEQCKQPDVLNAEHRLVAATTRSTHPIREQESLKRLLASKGRWQVPGRGRETLLPR
ncbi:nucleoside triphosphate hydrolase protein [Wolfiporia cocos MD-104 SS10]|uniref:Nucleoside triphosphate hydrolase protein n=1 Tax=Wolfiporia cocos (strain MD-104) TaxID=742152 RepID=A0A2H3JCE5_WOLCO|nr:nucleoside triphosphate hydrolase protein [Wolfiporia cocos MD-104 SS10]